MSKEIHILIQREYDKKQQIAYSDMIDRRKEVFEKIPEIKEIDRKIHNLGVNYNKMILASHENTNTSLEFLEIELTEFKKQRNILLENNGFAQNYLEPAYECDKCKDTGFIGVGRSTIKCTCYTQQLINYFYEAANIKLIESNNFDNFNELLFSNDINPQKYGLDISPRKNINTIKESCIRFIENFKNPEEKNLYFFGPTGVGKTFMSNAIAKELLERGVTVLYQTSPNLFDVINDYKMKSGVDKSFDDSNYKYILNVELLIIDDLGIEPISSAKYTELLTILNSRNLNNQKKPCKTIISTNLDMRKIHEFYTERVVSRIIGDFEIFKFIGDDIRLIKK